MNSSMRKNPGRTVQPLSSVSLSLRDLGRGTLSKVQNQGHRDIGLLKPQNELQNSRSSIQTPRILFWFPRSVHQFSNSLWCNWRIRFTQVSAIMWTRNCWNMWAKSKAIFNKAASFVTKEKNWKSVDSHFLQLLINSRADRATSPKDNWRLRTPMWLHNQISNNRFLVSRENLYFGRSNPTNKSLKLNWPELTSSTKQFVELPEQ